MACSTADCPFRRLRPVNLEPGKSNAALILFPRLTLVVIAEASLSHLVQKSAPWAEVAPRARKPVRHGY